MDETQSVLTGTPGPRIRVLFLITQMDTGGVQFQLLLRLRHLDPSRFDCRIGVLTGGSSRFLDEIRHMGVPIEFLQTDQDDNLFARVRRLRQFIRGVEPDVVDSMLTWDNTYGNLAATLAGVPLVIAELQTLRGGIRNYPVWFRWFEALSLRLFCDRVVCCSEGARDSYRRALVGAGGKMSVIHDAIDRDLQLADGPAARKALGLPNDVPVVSTIGRFSAEKDHETLLRAVPLVVNQHPDALFLLTGYGPLRERLVALARDLRVEHAVRFLDGERVDPYTVYAASDVYAMTSRREGFPIVLLEAMALGLPAVSTDVGGIPEMITSGKSGLLCRPGDFNAVGAAISRLLGSRELRESFGCNGREHVLAHFSIQTLIRKWSALYDSVSPLLARKSSARFDHDACAVEDAERPVGTLPGQRPTDVHRVLMMRLCPIDRFRQIAAETRKRYQGAEIDVLCQRDASGWISEDESRLNPIVYGSGAFALRLLGFRRLLSLRHQRYDLVLLPYADAALKGYVQAELAALWSSRGRASGVSAWRPQIGAGWTFSWRWFLLTRAVRLLSVVVSAAVVGAGIVRGVARGRGLGASLREGTC